VVDAVHSSAAVCRLALDRVRFAGGFVCHPLYYLLSPRFDGTWVRLDQLPAEWLLSL